MYFKVFSSWKNFDIKIKKNVQILYIHKKSRTI